MVANEHTDRQNLLNDILRNELLALIAFAVLAIGLQRMLQLGRLFPWKVVVAFVIGSLLVLGLAVRHLPARSLGPANQVTLARAGLVTLLVGLIGDVTAVWLVVVVASTVLALDGLDGWLARRLGIVSAFGARFDMETDALLLVVLTVLAWQYEKAGWWILLAGFMRYGFVASGYVLTWLRRPLPPSRRRQTAYVIQSISLIVCISPLFPQPLSGIIALLGLIVLSWSFAIDILHLAGNSSDRIVERGS